MTLCIGTVEQEVSEAIARLPTFNTHKIDLPLSVITRHLFLRTTPKTSRKNDLALFINNIARAFENLEDDPHAASQLRDAARFELCKLLTQHNGASGVLRLLDDYERRYPSNSYFVSDELHGFITCAISLDLTHIISSVKGGWTWSGFYQHRLPSPIALAARSPHRRQLFDLLLAREDCGDVVRLAQKQDMFAAWQDAASHGNTYAAHEISRRYDRNNEHVPLQFVHNEDTARQVVRPLIKSNDLQSMKDLVILLKQTRQGDMIGDVIVTQACMVGNPDMLALALVDLKVEIEDYSSESPLVETAARGHACLLPLLKERCQTAWENCKGYMLLEAGQSGYGCVAKAFADLGETRKTLGRAYTRALHISTEAGQSEFVEALVEHFGIPDDIHGQYKVARLAASLGFDAILRILAARGCYLGSYEPEWVPSPLLWAIALDHPSTVQSLLDLGEKMEDPLKSPFKERFRRGQFPRKRGKYREKVRNGKKDENPNEGSGEDDDRDASSENETPWVLMPEHVGDSADQNAAADEPDDIDISVIDAQVLQVLNSQGNDEMNS